MLAVIHARVIREEDRTKVLLDLNQRGLARLDGSAERVNGIHEAKLPVTVAARRAKCDMTIESLPPEKSSTGRVNCAATSRMTKIASDSSCFKWERI